MAVRKTDTIFQYAPAENHPIEYLTENNFSIVRGSDLNETILESAPTHSFVVRDPYGYELEITVEIAGEVIAEVIRRTRGRISLTNSFWISLAERHLADYLWENDDYPPDARLLVDQLTPDDFDLAIRWERNDHVSKNTLIALGMVIALMLCWGRAEAQQTIFNVPTTDVLDKGKVYFELDVSFKPNDSAAVNRFSSFVPRVVVGAGNQVEVGLNVTGNIQPGPDSTTLSPTIKWKVYQGKDNGLAIVIGDNIFVPVRNRAYHAGNFAYAEISKTFKAGTRITAGAYNFTRNVVAAANRAGGQFGFEQPLNKKVTLAADWFTGKHSAGYFTPGAVFKLGSKVTGYAGYSIGNQNASRGNNFFLLEFGYNFN